MRTTVSVLLLAVLRKCLVVGLCAKASWPEPAAHVRMQGTVVVSGTFDGMNRSYHGVGDGSQDEGQPPVFVVAPGGTIRNVIIGPPAGDGIHCMGSCLLHNVWWADVGEDAATAKGPGDSDVMHVVGGGARLADDKVFQHNGGGTVVIENFQVRGFGKLYRSCGNCEPAYKRKVVIRNVVAADMRVALVGLNADMGDTASISNVTVVRARHCNICNLYNLAAPGAEPELVGQGDGFGDCSFDARDVQCAEGGRLQS